MLPETVSPVVKRLLLSMFILCLISGCTSEDTAVDGGAEVEGGEPAGTPAGVEVSGVEAGAPAGVEAGTPAGAEGGSPAGTEGGAQAGVEGGSPAGGEAGSPAGGEAGATGGAGGGDEGAAVNELDEEGRRAFCEGQINSFLGLIPADGAEREAYIEQSCSFAGLIEESEADCEQAVADCRAEIENLNVDEAVTECMSGEVFNSCAASAESFASCQVAQTTFYADLVQDINISGVSCSDAGNLLALGGVLAQLMEAPSDLCEPEALACLD